MTPAVAALGGTAAVAVVAVALGLGIYANEPRFGGLPPDDPRSRFMGTWYTRDADSSTPTMTVTPTSDGGLDVVVIDDMASVCSRTPSTMVGTGRLNASGAFVIPAPAYTCDDGSEPRSLSGPPLDVQLRNLTFVHDRGSETLTDNLGAFWVREGTAARWPTPTPLQIMWPQSTLAEVREAQRLADAGDPRVTWQVDPGMTAVSQDSDLYDAEIYARFLREEIGWEAFQAYRVYDYNYGNGFSSVGFIRCEPGATNPVYPNDTTGSGCAPTIDRFHYELVVIDVAQPARQGASGVWVVTRWVMHEPLEQAVPPSDAEIAALVEPFLQARIDGDGAEQYAGVPDPLAPSHEIPLLYATTTGARYERSAFEVVAGPVWPVGWIWIKAEFVAEGGTLVEQLFTMRNDDRGRLRLEYDYNLGMERAPTTENGRAVPVRYQLSGGVIFGAAWPWNRDPNEPQAPRLVTLTRYGEAPSYWARLAAVVDPRPIDRGCEEGPAPANLDALVRSIQADPDLQVTAPVAVTIAGLPALRLDVEQAAGASVCEHWAQSVAVTASLVNEDSRMRLYLVELPGTSPRIMTIAISASKQDFDRVMEGEAPLLASFEFPTE